MPRSQQCFLEEAHAEGWLLCLPSVTTPSLPPHETTCPLPVSQVSLHPFAPSPELQPQGQGGCPDRVQILAPPPREQISGDLSLHSQLLFDGIN